MAVVHGLITPSCCHDGARRRPTIKFVAFVGDRSWLSTSLPGLNDEKFNERPAARDDVAADQKHRRGVPDAVATLRRGRRSGNGRIWLHNLLSPHLGPHYVYGVRR